jgi:hypothetical protein
VGFTFTLSPKWGDNRYGQRLDHLQVKLSFVSVPFHFQTVALIASGCELPRQKDLKKGVWHPQIEDLFIAIAANGFNIL